ncbi:hypothetical protein LCGC14_2877140 [marine sediment metagenome]|uniref:Uncharacterized protein n=1 Tax=marine sediment metagenome TaxID=412755 RepID=A0A0F9ASD8_9ZZZZ
MEVMKISENLVEKYVKNPNLSKDWVKEMLKQIDERLNQMNEQVINIKNKLDDKDQLNYYWKDFEEFDVVYSALQEQMISFHDLFLES